jgi:hypothetical protein
MLEDTNILIFNNIFRSQQYLNLLEYLIYNYKFIIVVVLLFLYLFREYNLMNILD